MSDGIQQYVKRQLLLATALAALAIIPTLAGNSSLSVVLGWCSGFVSLLFLSIAAAIIISSGHVDIATGPVMSLLGMIIIFMLAILGPTMKAVLIAHLAAIAGGIVVYGLMFLVVQKGLSSLITTLGMLFVAKGLSTFLQVCFQGASQICGPDVHFFANRSGVVPANYVVSAVGRPVVSALIAISLILVVFIWRFYTRSGLDHVAVGLNPDSAKFAGVSASKVHCVAFLLAGILVVCATFVRLHGTTNGGWSADTGWGEELLAIAVAVVGGTRITGGRFDPIAVLFAALVVYAMRDVITNDLGLPSETASAAFGVVIALVAWLDTRSKRASQ